jgi:hypothetical protein
MTSVEINGTELLCTRVGHGTPALVLHGGLGIDETIYRTGRESRNWGRIGRRACVSSPISLGADPQNA